MIIILSILVLFFSFLILLLSLNYSVIHWEENKILSLSRKNRAKNSFTGGVDNVSIHKPSSMQNILSSISTQQNYSDMKQSFNAVIKKNAISAFAKTKQFFSQLIELSKPVKHISSEFVEVDYKQSQVSNAGINEKQQIPVEIRSDFEEKTIKSDLRKEYNKEMPKSKILEEATIGLAPEKDSKSEELGMFEKLEARLYEKLKQSGMSNYDIWLELGDLYHKYDDNKKALEIYALVSKHSKDELQRKIAVNKLIGL
jgi:hypothetical protein